MLKMTKLPKTSPKSVAGCGRGLHMVSQSMSQGVAGDARGDSQGVARVFWGNNCLSKRCLPKSSAKFTLHWASLPFCVQLGDHLPIQMCQTQWGKSGERIANQVYTCKQSSLQAVCRLNMLEWFFCHFSRSFWPWLALPFTGTGFCKGCAKLDELLLCVICFFA